MKSFYEDISDQEYIQKTQNQPDWVIFPEKVPEELIKIFHHDEIIKYFNNGMIKLPFAKGESIMLSHVLFSGYEKQTQENQTVSLITEDPIHKKLLKHRISRGIRNLETRNGIKIDQNIRKALDVANLIPIPADISEIIRLRENQKFYLDKIRENIIKLADIMKNPLIDNLDFDRKVTEIDTNIRNIFMDMGYYLPNKEKIITERNPLNNTVPKYLGGIKLFTLGVNTEPNIATGLSTKEDTLLSREISSDMNMLKQPTTSYEI